MLAPDLLQSFTGPRYTQIKTGLGQMYESSKVQSKYAGSLLSTCIHVIETEIDYLWREEEDES